MFCNQLRGNLHHIVVSQNVNLGLHPHQIVVWFDAKELSEVAKSQWGVCFQTEIWEVMCRGQVATLTGTHTKYSLV